MFPGASPPYWMFSNDWDVLRLLSPPPYWMFSADWAVLRRLEALRPNQTSGALAGGAAALAGGAAADDDAAPPPGGEFCESRSGAFSCHGNRCGLRPDRCELPPDRCEENTGEPGPGEDGR